MSRAQPGHLQLCRYTPKLLGPGCSPQSEHRRKIRMDRLDSRTTTRETCSMTSAANSIGRYPKQSLMIRPRSVLGLNGLWNISVAQEVGLSRTCTVIWEPP